MITDSLGLIFGNKEDKGDSCHRTCMYALGQLFFKNKRLNFPVTSLQDPRDKYSYLRHPDRWGWWADSDRFSRDQATPLVICLGEYGHLSRLRKFFIRHILRLGFMTNTRRNGVWKDEAEHRRKAPDWKPWNYSWKLPDYCFLEFWGLYIRAFRAWYLYPLLYICDLETLLGSIIWKYKDKDEDVLNHLIVTTYINRVYPTFVGRRSYKIIDKHKFNTNLQSYFERVGASEMAKLWFMK